MSSLVAFVHGSIHAKLLLSYLLVVAVAGLTLTLVILFITPSVANEAHRRIEEIPELAELTEATREDTITAFQNALFWAALLAVAAAAVTAIGSAMFISRRITIPLQHLVESSAVLVAGDYSVRVPARETDEIGQLARTFNRLAETLELSEQRRTQLLGEVAHELRNPLALIQGYTEGLLDGVLEPSPELWALLDRETGRLRRLVDDLHDLSRAEAGQVRLYLQPVDLRALIEEMLARFEAQLGAARLKARVDIAENLPDALIDPDRTAQVLTNVLGNAVRYTPPGGAVTVTAEADPPGMLTVCVTDTGIGIAPEQLTQIFERFYRADPSRARTLGGSGIGLTIARALVEQQGGTIRASSPGAGKGTAIEILLPRAAS
jgi:histidine kinase